MIKPRHNDGPAFYKFCQSEEKSSTESQRLTQIYLWGIKTVTTHDMAIAFGINLMPCDCIEILKKVYGKKLETMNPKTIYDKVYNLMRTIEEEPNEQFIIDEVNYYIES